MTTPVEKKLESMSTTELETAYAALRYPDNMLEIELVKAELDKREQAKHGGD